MRPGASVVPLASMTTATPSASMSFSLPMAAILPSIARMVSASRIGFSRSPLSSRPMLRIKRRVCGLVDSSRAIAFTPFARQKRYADPRARSDTATNPPVYKRMRRSAAVPAAKLSARRARGLRYAGRGMIAQDLVLWEVDTQKDFMLPGGKLYVPGAEKLLPNIQKLTDAARRGRCFLVSHGCFHTPDDPEFKAFPPHCVKGTAGSEYVPQALTDKVARVGNDAAALPENFLEHKQILLEKQTLDIFESRHAASL